MNWLDGVTLGIAAAGFFLSLYNFYRTFQNSVRVREERTGGSSVLTLQLFNDSPHAVTVVKVGCIGGAGRAEDKAGAECSRARIEARDTISLEIPQGALSVAAIERIAFQRCGWWVEISTGQRYMSEGWVTRVSWYIRCQIYYYLRR